jgi:adenylosuccinate synthase
MNIAILGSLWGDEGKGHITHAFSTNYNWVIRFNGGANAGHTIYRDNKKFIHNLLPSFDWRRGDMLNCFLASGMVIDLEQLYKEIVTTEDFASKEWHYQLGDIARRVYIDPDAFVVLPQHKEEDARVNGHLGTTKRGIGPAYRDKICRCGKKVKDLINEKDPWAEKLKEIGVNFKYVLELENRFKQEDLLFEGAQGIMLDINHGCYPYVSCSDASISGIYSSGFSFVNIDKVYGITKCYLTKVGEGPFPTEIVEQEEAEQLRSLGNEYGATTGRPRRVGWLDLPALKYACKVGGIDRLIMTKLDILSNIPEITICPLYKKEPVCSSDFFSAKPMYITVPGWTNPKNYNETRNFCDIVEKFVELPIEYISCGTSTSDIIRLKWI